MGLLGSLLLFTQGLWPVQAADRLEVEIDGVVLPITVEELGLWVRSGGRSRSELNTWLMLLDADSRAGLIRLLKAPVLTRRSFGQQMLRSWAARPLLDALGDLIRVEGAKGVRSQEVLTTLERLLSKQASVSTLDLLEALPNERLRLDLDALVLAASRWRHQMQRHQVLTAQLASSTATAQSTSAELTSERDVSMRSMRLAADHRPEGVRVQIWSPPPERSGSTSSWVVLMPGLGGDPEHFHWLARALASQGWPVVVIGHPGSDAAAVQALLDGRSPFVGAKALRQRLADLKSVLGAHRSDQLAIDAEEVVLVGHSLGALTALLAAGAEPVNGLEERCQLALKDLPLTNLSQLLQCELAAGEVLTPLPPSTSLKAVVGLNSFGSLIWPSTPLGSLQTPLLLMGGTFDLITPPLSEQLALLGALGNHPASRAVIVEGASHFSPVRVEGQAGNGRGDDLFQLGENLVGIQPLAVQRQLAGELIQFLREVELGESMGMSQHLHAGSIRWHRLNRDDAKRLVKDSQ